MSSATPTTKYVPDDEEPLSTALVAALSEAKGRDVTKDECILYDSIDTDALDGLFRQERDGDTVKVEFATHDAIVIIWGDGMVTIEIQDLEDDPNHS